MKARAQFIRFIVVGVFATIINYSVFWIILKTLGPRFYILASVSGFISGVIAGYLPNKKWSFQAEDDQKTKKFKYLLIYTISLFISILMLHLFVEFLKVDTKIANFLTICITTLVNFIGVKIFVFPNNIAK